MVITSEYYQSVRNLAPEPRLPHFRDRVPPLIKIVSVFMTVSGGSCPGLVHNSVTGARGSRERTRRCELMGLGTMGRRQSELRPMEYSTARETETETETESERTDCRIQNGG